MWTIEKWSKALQLSSSQKPTISHSRQPFSPRHRGWRAAVARARCHISLFTTASTINFQSFFPFNLIRFFIWLLLLLPYLHLIFQNELFAECYHRISIRQQNESLLFFRSDGV
jgi:hypothetical protein